MDNVHEKVTGGGKYQLTYDGVTQSWEISQVGVWGPFARVVRREGQSIQECEANARAMCCAGSMVNALWAIANMQIKEETDKEEVLALCISIAKIELAKCSRED